MPLVLETLVPLVSKPQVAGGVALPNNALKARSVDPPQDSAWPLGHSALAHPALNTLPAAENVLLLRTVPGTCLRTSAPLWELMTLSANALAQTSLLAPHASTSLPCPIANGARLPWSVSVSLLLALVALWRTHAIAVTFTDVLLALPMMAATGATMRVLLLASTVAAVREPPLLAMVIAT